MRHWPTLGLLGFCLLSSGCQLAWDITTNIAFETCMFTDHIHSSVYYYRLACDAWAKYRSAHPDLANQQDFAKGFKHGYAEFLEDGGIPGTPPLPPQRYWKKCYQSPEGRNATALWSAGFKEGSLAAKASGYRNFVVVPAGKCDTPPGGAAAPNSAAAPAAGLGMPLPGGPSGPLNPSPRQPAPPPEPELPAPRLAPQGAAPGSNYLINPAPPSTPALPGSQVPGPSLPPPEARPDLGGNGQARRDAGKPAMAYFNYPG
jgi:hypothetical protein